MRLSVVYILYPFHLTRHSVISVSTTSSTEKLLVCFLNILKTYSLRNRDEQTTDTLEAAMAADAIHGCNATPTGNSTPEMEKYNLLYMPLGDITQPNKINLYCQTTKSTCEKKTAYL